MASWQRLRSKESATQKKSGSVQGIWIPSCSWSSTHGSKQLWERWDLFKNPAQCWAALDYDDLFDLVSVIHFSLSVAKSAKWSIRKNGDNFIIVKFIPIRGFRRNRSSISNVYHPIETDIRTGFWPIEAIADSSRNWGPIYTKSSVWTFDDRLENRRW